MTVICKVCHGDIDPLNTQELCLWVAETEIIDSDEFCSIKCIAKELERIANVLRLNPLIIGIHPDTI